VLDSRSLETLFQSASGNRLHTFMVKSVKNGLTETGRSAMIALSSRNKGVPTMMNLFAAFFFCYFYFFSFSAKQGKSAFCCK